MRWICCSNPHIKPFLLYTSLHMGLHIHPTQFSTSTCSEREYFEGEMEQVLPASCLSCHLTNSDKACSNKKGPPIGTQWSILSSLTTRHTHTHTPTHPFNGPLSGTTWVSRYQKGKTNLDFTEARDSEWLWHQLGHMQVCTSLQTNNHASTPPLRFLQAGCPSCRPTNSVKALKGFTHHQIYK